MDQVFTAIDLTSVAQTVAGIGVAIIGIWMVYKAVDLGKRAVKKA